MIVVQLADLCICVDAKYSETQKLLDRYTVSSGNPVFTVSATDSGIKAERVLSPEPFSDGYLETVCIHRAIASQLPAYDALLVHAATIAYEGKAYAFAAPSGIGKSTHIALWRKVFGSKVSIVNGDKPIFRFKDGILRAYGTPWSGKERWDRNTSLPLGGICILKRGETNTIQSISPEQALAPFLNQILIPKNADMISKTLELADRILNSVPLWELHCTPTEDAARLAESQMTHKT